MARPVASIEITGENHVLNNDEKSREITVVMFHNQVLMWTNQWIYFVLLVVAALVWVRFGFYPVIVIVAGFVALSLWSHLRHPSAWKGDGYTVKVLLRFKDSWVDYEEAGRTLSFRAEWGETNGDSELMIWIEQNVYFPPDYKNALSEGRVAEIQKRVAEGLEHLKIRYSFTRMGWTSFK